MAYELDRQHGNEYSTPIIYCDKPRKFTVISSLTIQNQSRDRRNHHCYPPRQRRRPLERKTATQEIPRDQQVSSLGSAI